MKNKLYRAVNLRILSFFTIFLQISSVCGGYEPIVYDAGKARVFQVMYQGPGGIDDVNRKTLYAETKNLTLDLNLAEISARFGCKTLMGQGFIAKTLAKPVSPLDKNNTIQHRRGMIQLFKDHPELQEKFEALIQQAVEHEAVVMKFMQGRFTLSPSDNFFTYFNNVRKKSTFFQSYNQWMSGLNLARQTEKLSHEFVDSWKSTGDFFNLPIGQKGLLVFLSLFGLTATDFGNALPESMQKQSPAALAWQSVPFTAYTMYGIGSGLYEHYVGALEIRNSLYALNQLIDISQQIESLCREQGVHNQFKLSAVRFEEGLKLLQDLQHERYQEKDSNFFLTPAVHAFLYDIYENDINLAPIYASIAEIDAYLAIARKMTELENSDHKFTYVEFLDNPKPTIQAKEFWNMLVTKGDVVTNNISENKNIILTGSNEGGKTTTIRAILQNIVLAQTFGIAAASQFSLTQFDVINSYLNVSDDILNGKSRFASELKQAQDILTRINALQPTEKFFFAFDELFTGTNGEDGAECAYRFIDNVASYKGIQFIYATHFNKLKTIGSINPACANYKIEPPLRDKKGAFIRDDKGQLIYPYKLSPGANNVNVAMDRAKDAGIFA